MPPVRPLFLLALTALPLAAQAPTGAPDTSAFRRLELPPPSATRSANGAPGSAYWQQRADYVIRASLDTTTRMLRGEARITYRNNSPDTLRYLWLHVDQNLFTPESRGHRVFSQRENYGAGADSGLRLVKVSQPAAAAARGRPAAPAATLPYSVNGTLVRVDLAQPLPPRGRQVLEVGWTMAFGPNRNRMGIEEIDGSVVYEVAQWYPRLVVYDDIRGWNADQYYGQGEFYLEYGSFDVSLTVPANMILAATGTLQNPDGSADRGAAFPARRGTNQPHNGGHPRPGRDRRSRLTARRSWPADLAVQGRQRARLRLRRRHPLHLGRRRGQRGQDAGDELLPAVRGAAVEGRHRVREVRARDELDGLGALSVPGREQCAWRRGWNGVSDDRLLPRARHAGDALQRDRSRVRAHLVSDGRGVNERRYGWMDEGFNELINHYNWEKRFGQPPAHRARRQDYLAMATSGMEKPIMTRPTSYRRTS